MFWTLTMTFDVTIDVLALHYLISRHIIVLFTGNKLPWFLFNSTFLFLCFLLPPLLASPIHYYYPFYTYLLLYFPLLPSHCRQGDDGSVGPVGDGRMHDAISHTCLSTSAEYELALILKELRWITDQVISFYFTYTYYIHKYIIQ